MTPKEFAIRILKEAPSVTTVSIDESGTVPVIVVWFSDVFKISIKGPNNFGGTPEEYRYSYILSESGTNISANWSDADGILRIMNECETPAAPDNQQSE